MSGVLTQAQLKGLLHYDPDTGAFTAKTARGRVRAGDVVGWIVDGYRRVGVNRRQYQAHRLAFLYMTGELPTLDVDHINGDRADNRWCNLREVSRTVNMENLRAAHADSGSGLLGAFRAGNRWCSKIRVAGNTRHLGSFATAQEAHCAYLAAKRELHAGCTI